MSGSEFVVNHRIGDTLVRKNSATPRQITLALRAQKLWGSRFSNALFAIGYRGVREFHQALAEQNHARFVDLMKEAPDHSLLDPTERANYIKYASLPWRKEGDKTILATSDPTEDFHAWARGYFGDAYDFVITSHYDILWQNQALFSTFDDEDARESLWRARPLFSAKFLFTHAQRVSLFLIFTTTCFSLYYWPVQTAMVLSLMLQLFYALAFVLKTILTIEGMAFNDFTVTQEEIDQLKDHELPVYTVLVPMYKESEVLPLIARALKSMNYPRSKLDIKLVLEQDDKETIDAAKALGLEPIFEIIRVPPSNPRTKPKACNYALRFARGELLTIYDAEDKPDPDQLKKAVVAFKKLGPSYVCVQGKLNYFNSRENILTRMFALEYSHWFDIMLPGLHSLNLPIPLGGTSNHFRTSVLQEMGAWDPYNVTEDADLGIRINQSGYRVGTIDSTTYEEATIHISSWIKQRTRWCKGYMQTYIVHMRSPRVLLASLGMKGFLGFQFFIGGPILVNLFNPILHIITLLTVFGKVTFFAKFFPPVILTLAILNVVSGTFLLSVFGGLGAVKRKAWDQLPWVVFYPIYWLLHSVATWRALIQLFRAPHLWEKTMHGKTQLVS